MNRRQVVSQLSAFFILACRRTSTPVDTDTEPADEPTELLPFLLEDDQAVGVIEGAGLDGRLAYDHENLDADGLVTATEDFFIRTLTPLGWGPEGWTVELPEGPITAEALGELASDQGVVLLECSGNGANRHFGLISAAQWSGVRLADLMDVEGDPLVEIMGLDVHPPPTTNSVEGASWIFRWSDLSEGFLATGMNGEPLTPDHGAPVRVVVPGWYGCTQIKWVQSIRIVPEDASSTSQMREFAQRTHQSGTPASAADFAPAVAQCSAMVVRAERYDNGDVRFTGVAWGSRSGTLTLHVGNRSFPSSIHMNGPQTTWELWSVRIAAADLPSGDRWVYLTPDDPIPAVRLDERYYERRIALS